LVTTLAGLKDQRQGAQTQLAWVAGAQAIGTTGSITVGWSTPIKMRVAAAINIDGLPAGLKVTVGLATSEGGAGDTNVKTTTIKALNNGSKGVYVAWPEGVDAIYGFTMTFFNDVAGATAVDAEAEFTIGELWGSEAFKIDIKPDWSFGFVSGSVTNVSVSGQPSDSIALPRRQLTVQTAHLENFSDSFIIENSLDRVRYVLAQNNRTLITPIETPEESTGLLMMYATLADSRQVGLPKGGRLFEASFTFEELR
jgi:hypothetical protein